MESLKHGLATGTHHEKPIESGVRLNVTSDIQYHKMMPKKFFDKHKASKFYDYTKNHGTVKNRDSLPKNYTVGLSHTGDSHHESNSHETIKHLKEGGISAMVFQKPGKTGVEPKRVKVHGSKEGEHEWKVVNGDDDDNLDQRHEQAAKEHDVEAKVHHNIVKNSSDKEEIKSHTKMIEHHKNMAKEYRAGKRGVVSGLKLKGVKNEDAGIFANKVDEHGTIWLHDHGPQQQLRKKHDAISKAKKEITETMSLKKLKSMLGCNVEFY